MVISGGFNIYPAELENVIAPTRRSSTSQCVKPEASVTEKELVELCSVHLGNYKRPGKIVSSRDPLPKTPVGKIKRKELREPFWVGHEQRVAGN